MAGPRAVSVGIDTTSGNHALTFAALDEDLRLIRLAESDVDDVLGFLRLESQAMVAINSPSHVSTGVVRRRLERETPAGHRLRGAAIREAEFELQNRGIAVGSTPPAEALCPAWVQAGLDLYRRLSQMGYRTFPTERAPHQWLETHPHAGFCALLGRAPLPKPSLEGRLQRALVLFERGLGIRDPMAFFEEVTRHRMLQGQLPTEILPQPAELDALVAAYTARLAWSDPTNLARFGNKQEGYIVLPMGALKTTYRS